MMNSFLDTDYLIYQLKGLLIALEGGGANQYSRNYVREKLDMILSGRGINFHELVKQAVNLEEEKEPKITITKKFGVAGPFW